MCVNPSGTPSILTHFHAINNRNVQLYIPLIVINPPVSYVIRKYVLQKSSDGSRAGPIVPISKPSVPPIPLHVEEWPTLRLHKNQERSGH